MPAFFAAMWNRGAPDRLSRSSNATAGTPNPAAASMSSSGCEAPSRKLKAERAWSSAYMSVVDPFDKPLADIQVEIDPVEPVAFQFHVPFVARPARPGPPFPGGAPRTGGLRN